MLVDEDFFEEAESQGPVNIHHNKIKEIFQSKHELWKFLCSDGGVYLPIYQNSSM